MSYPLWKRVCDIVSSFFGLVIFAIFFPFIGLAIVIESGFPILVQLDRVSEGKLTRVYKFRTMIKNARDMKQFLFPMNERTDGPLFKMKNDPRVTKVGKVVRKLRLDELPQFIDVFMGRLALVGPRPHEPGEVEKYPEEYKKVTFARAGLTGLSQVSGASSLSFQKEIELDTYYIEHQSFFLDCKIAIKTAFILFFDPTGV